MSRKNTAWREAKAANRAAWDMDTAKAQDGEHCRAIDRLKRSLLRYLESVGWCPPDGRPLQ